MDHLPASDEFRDVLRQVTNRDPAERPSVAEFLAALDTTPESRAASDTAGPLWF